MADTSGEVSAVEEATFVSALADGTMAGAEFADELFSRCRDAIIAPTGTGSATPLDVAVLIRQVMRRASERDEIGFRMIIGPERGIPVDPEVWRSVGVTVMRAVDGRPLLGAEPYRPAWLAAGDAVRRRGRGRYSGGS